MSKFLHVLFQAISIVAQYGNLASGYVAPKYQPLVAASIGVAQAVVGLSTNKAIGPTKETK